MTREQLQGIYDRAWLLYYSSGVPDPGQMRVFHTANERILKTEEWLADGGVLVIGVWTCVWSSKVMAYPHRQVGVEMLLDRPYRLESEGLGMRGLIQGIAVTLDRRLGTGTRQLVMEPEFHRPSPASESPVDKRPACLPLTSALSAVALQGANSVDAPNFKESGQGQPGWAAAVSRIEDGFGKEIVGRRR